MRSELTARLTPEALIRGAHNLVRRHRSWKGQPLWTLVSELTCHGSTYSVEICRGLGFNPEHKIGGTLAPRAESETPVAHSKSQQKRLEVQMGAFTTSKPKMGMGTICDLCGTSFGEHIALTSGGKHSVCPDQNRGA